MITIVNSEEEASGNAEEPWLLSKERGEGHQEDVCCNSAQVNDCRVGNGESGSEIRSVDGFDGSESFTPISVGSHSLNAHPSSLILRVAH